MINDEASKIRLKKEDIQNLPEFMENPFKGSYNFF